MSSSRDDLLIEIDTSGRVHAPQPVAARLAQVAGRWRLAPSLADLLVLERDQKNEGERKSGVMMCGAIDLVGGLANVFTFVHFSQLDGVLDVLSGRLRRTLHFRKGQLLAATSNLPEDRLGALLVRFGLITEEQLVAAAREITPTRRLGNVLVEKGLMTSHDLYEGVKRQAEEVFYSVLLIKQGVFYLHRASEEGGPPARLHLDTQSLLLEGLRRMDEMSHFRGKIPSPEVVMARRIPAPAAQPEGNASAVYQLIDGLRTIAEVARMTRLGEFATTKAAFELLATGFVEVREAADLHRQAPIPDESLPANAAAGILRAYNDALAKLYPTMAAKGKTASLRQGVAAFLAGSARFANLFKDVHVGEDGTLAEERVLSNVKGLPPAERLELLQRGLNELLFFVLFVAGDAIDPQEEKELHERVAKALESLPK
jgi:hypothetical protein